MKQLGKYLLIFLLIIITIGVAMLLKTFVFGKIIEVGSIGVSNIAVNDELIEISIISTNSMGSYKNFSYEIIDNVIYIKLTATGSLSNWDGKIKLEGDFSDTKEIYFRDNKEKKLIWQKQ